ncbi:hypothetical protein AURDEDRAFT_177885 [Auricularia subglabra TFB-10046 SS5]|uniref:Uncharacterized protein n=1 Tax=Auricularia subglabra (strain TFB-10046 / SS5) TaxID=717982 RepID=J0WMI6_AURST|nr:hypothetical protein AURDEDRAFT_177885 [Auricularia subglabra TFB-10046 SS5]
MEVETLLEKIAPYIEEGNGEETEMAADEAGRESVGSHAAETMLPEQGEVVASVRGESTMRRQRKTAAAAQEKLSEIAAEECSEDDSSNLSSHDGPLEIDISEAQDTISEAELDDDDDDALPSNPDSDSGTDDPDDLVAPVHPIRRATATGKRKVSKQQAAKDAANAAKRNAALQRMQTCLISHSFIIYSLLTKL